MTVQQQAYAFAAMAGCGCALGIVYDLLAAAASLSGGGRAIRAVLDVFFCLLCAAALILTALFLRTQAARGYVFAAATLGFAAYMGTAGRIVRYLSKKIRKNVRKNQKLYEKCQN